MNARQKRWCIEGAEYLESLPDDARFDMGQFIDLEYEDGLKPLREALANPCGTTACAAGKFGLLPKFRRRGFRWAWWGPDDIHNSKHRLRFRYKGLWGVPALREAFGYDAAEFMANPPYRSEWEPWTPGEVAAELRIIVEESP